MDKVATYEYQLTGFLTFNLCIVSLSVHSCNLDMHSVFWYSFQDAENLLHAVNTVYSHEHQDSIVLQKKGRGQKYTNLRRDLEERIGESTR